MYKIFYFAVSFIRFCTILEELSLYISFFVEDCSKKVETVSMH